jgi:hypothetical protein
VFYGLAVFSLSSLKLLWLDELITLHIARLPSIAAIWRALQMGADPNPPMIHILVHVCRRLFGEHEFALRLPAIAGYWIGLFSLFAYLRKRLPAIWALGGAVLSMTMAAFEYSYESRSYGLFYGFAMLAILCWATAAENGIGTPARRRALAGMTLALAAGIVTNYFAILAFVPIAGGEMVRSIARMRAGKPFRNRGAGRFLATADRGLNALDLPVWICMFAAAAPLAAFRSMIAHSIQQFSPYAWNKVSMQQVFDSYTGMVEIVFYPLLAILTVRFVLRPLFFELWRRAQRRYSWIEAAGVREPSMPKAGLPGYEIAAVLLLMAYPFLGYAVASIRGGMLSPRFVIPVCFGFAIAGTIALFQLFGSARRTGAIFLGIGMLWFVARESVVGYWYLEQKQCFYKVLNTLPQAELAAMPGAPIVIGDPLLVLTFEHYAPPAMAKRVEFPIDFSAVRRYRHDDSPEENLWAGRNVIYHFPIVSLASFESSVGSYLIVAYDGDWLLNELEEEQYPVAELAIDTRAGAIGGFTPLSRGKPAFYLSTGDGPFDNNVPSPAPASRLQLARNAAGTGTGEQASRFSESAQRDRGTR